MDVKRRPMETWPNFFIVGAPKAGTTAIFHYLNQHPQIYMSTRKEPHYFSIKNVLDNDLRKKPIRNKTKYLNLFKNVKNEKIVGEASTSYLADPEAPKLIKKIIPDAKILISIRDPTERTFSAYLMKKNAGLMESTFHDQIQLELQQEIDLKKPNCTLKEGFYSESISRYLNIFDSNQIKIIIFEEWITDPKKKLEEIIKFLKIDIPIDQFKIKNPNPFKNPRGSVGKFLLQNREVKKIAELIIPFSARKNLAKKVLLKEGIKPKIDEVDRDILKGIFEKDVEQLKSILGRNLPWENFS